MGALFPIIIMFVIFYFLLIRPQQKKQQNIKSMQQTLRKDDKVLFCGGMYGKVVKVKDTTVTVEIAEKVKIDIQRGAITQISAQQDQD